MAKKNLRKHITFLSQMKNISYFWNKNMLEYALIVANGRNYLINDI